MKLRKYRAFWDDGHDTGEFEYYSIVVGLVQVVIRFLLFIWSVFIEIMIILCM